MEVFSRDADQIRREIKLVSVVDGPGQQQSKANESLNLNLTDVSVEVVHQESSNVVERRRSGRVRKKRSFSPEVEEAPVRRKKSKWKCSPSKAKSEGRKEARFCCDICKSPYITDPRRRGNRLKTSNYSPSPRRKNDPKTGRVLTLCNACGLAFDRPRRPHTPCTNVEASARKKHEEELREFTAAVTHLLGDQDAEKLCCPLFVKKPCQCLQNYIRRPGEDLSQCRHRALSLLQLLKEAKQLSSLKCYSESQVQVGKSRKRSIGLGNGQRKSKAFEEFVLRNRSTLRSELKLCERATQRILGYSNNFLHKKLKTDPEKGVRVERSKGKGALGLLKPIAELMTEKCCVDNCVLMARTHARLLDLWRERASKGQAEARRTLAEMLTPSGGLRSNCYKFISWVTGCSHSTIGRVSEQMKRTGGEREPPPHGLKRWWKGKARTQKKVGVERLGTRNPTNAPSSTRGSASVAAAASESITMSVPSVQLSSLPATVQIQVQQQQIEVLKKQVQILQQQQQQQHGYKPQNVSDFSPVSPQRSVATQQTAQHLQAMGSPQVTSLQEPSSVCPANGVIVPQQLMGLSSKPQALQQQSVSKEGPVMGWIMQNASHSQLLSTVPTTIGLIQDILQQSDIQILVQTLDLPCSVAGTIRPQPQAALLCNIPTNSANNCGNVSGQYSPFLDPGQVTIQEVPAQLVPISLNQELSAFQIQQKKERQECREQGQLLDSGPPEDLVLSQGQIPQVQASALTHTEALAHLRPRVETLKMKIQCPGGAEQLLKQPGLSALPQTQQLMPVTAVEGQVPVHSTGEQPPHIPVGAQSQLQCLTLSGFTSSQTTGSENHPTEQQIALPLGLLDVLQPHA
eukprot:gi/632964613/ref/XP_007898483.1/ PREDICTED: uncharacterized protein LOC103183049 isoform X2 [Callorhinchus milii]